MPLTCDDIIRTCRNRTPAEYIAVRLSRASACFDCRAAGYVCDHDRERIRRRHNCPELNITEGCLGWVPRDAGGTPAYDDKEI